MERVLLRILMETIKKNAFNYTKDAIYPNFSVAMCVYGGDNPKHFRVALKSIIYQTVPPKEIILVKDGPVSEEINKIIKVTKEECSQNNIDLIVISLETNQGHGNARRISIEKCQYEFIALMDADDISTSDRFEKELDLIKRKDVNVVGSHITEFIGHENNIVSRRVVCLTDDEIKNDLKRRCPLNQMTVMFAKDVYVKAGGYIDLYCEEDYYLWIRMVEVGAKFANVDSNLVNVRVGEKMYQRRGGIRYFNSEKKIQKLLLEKGYISYILYWKNIFIRAIVQVLLPNKLRGWVFRKVARK